MRRSPRVLIGGAALAAGGLVTACGGSGGAGSAASGVTAGDAWTRSITTPSGEAAVYVTVTNGTGRAVDITGATVPRTVAASASLHESMAAGDGSVMSMQPIDSVRVAPHRTVRFAPGGRHIMLEGVRRRFSDGAKFTLILSTGSGPKLRTPVTVRST